MISFIQVRARFVWLFASLCLLLVISPLFKGEGVGEFVLLGFFSFLIVAATYASVRRASVAIAMGFLVAAWMALSWFRLFSEFQHQPVLVDLLMVLVLTFAIAQVLYRVMSARKVDFNTLCGGISVYLLLAVSWALLFRVIEGVQPGSFALPDEDIYANFNQFIYFSLSSLTTLGYGDIAPLTPVARIWSTLEAVTGVLYIAVLVARLVSLYRSSD